MTEEQKLLSRKFIAYKFAMSFWIVGAVWLYFYRIFMGDAEIGMIESVAFFIGLLVEIPSGALADRFGRAKVAKIGLVMTAVGIAAQAIGGLWVILAFQIGVIAGQSLINGADEGLFYDKLKFKETSHQWRKLVTRGGQTALAASLLANVLGGFIYTFNPALTFILNGLGDIAAIAVIWKIKDEPIKRQKQTIRENLKSYFANIGAGVREFAKPKFRIYIPLIITIQGLFYACGWGLLRLVLVSRFGFSPFWGTVVISSCGIISIIALHLTHKYSEKLREKRILSLVALMSIFGLIFSAFDVGWWGYIVILLLYVGEHIMHPFLSEIFNKRAIPEQRSTILSVASFLKVLPYVILAPIIGFLNDNNSLEIFLIIWATLSIMAWIYYIFAKKKDSMVKISLQV